jgi:hypothetical protein
VPRFVVDVSDPVFDLVADEAMVDRRTVRDQAAVLIERALGLRPRLAERQATPRTGPPDAASGGLAEEPTR